MDTASRIQNEMAIIREENHLLRTQAASQVVQAPRRAAFTTTTVPWFDGTTSWEQYHQVFEAIVRSKGWDNDTAALQLFSHLEGDALNVAHLVPLVKPTALEQMLHSFLNGQRQRQRPPPRQRPTRRDLPNVVCFFCGKSGHTRFDGTTSWEQYHQVFEAIVRSNGWDNDTAALQLFSHLEGDALNVAHLVPLVRPMLRSGLVDGLTAHYGSPGRLADYRRQFERTTRTVGEDPAIFATALETLAVKAFGDMGQTTRLRLIQDRFIAAHSNCDLRRHWESRADPAVCRIGKPNPDPTYPTYAVGDSDSDNEATRVAVVTGQRLGQNQLEDLLQWVISTAERPALKPEVSDLEKLLQQLVREPQSRPPAVVNPPVPTALEHMLHSFLDGQRQRRINGPLWFARSTGRLPETV